MRIMLFAMGFLAFCTTSRAAALFVDHQFQPDGSEIDRVFETTMQNVTTTIDDAQATKKGVEWVTHYYKASGVRVLSSTARVSPIKFWIIRTFGSVTGTRDVFYAVVLSNGEIVEPKLVHKGNDVATLGQDIERSVPKPEIHGEIEFGFATGRGIGIYRPGYDLSRPYLFHEPANSDRFNGMNP
jgi:hypothetical protein